MGHASERTAKANAARAAKQQEIYRALHDLIVAEPGLDDWSYADRLGVSRDLVVRGLDTDSALIDYCVRKGRVAVPDRSLSLPRWTRHVPEDQLHQLPRFTRQNRAALLKPPPPDTGNKVVDADLMACFSAAIYLLIRQSPRKAREGFEDLRMRFSRFADIVRDLNRRIREGLDEIRTLKAKLQERQEQVEELTRKCEELEARVQTVSFTPAEQHSTPRFGEARN